MDELTVLQAVRLKGRVAESDLAATLLADPTAVGSAVSNLTAQGLLQGSGLLRLTDDGRQRLADLLATERTALDASVVTRGYEDFRPINAAFKGVVTDWQIRYGEMNDHTDGGYDGEVITRLRAVHGEAMPLIERLAEQLPRLRQYGAKLVTALDRIEAGDAAWFTRPMVDSYHTVWFELHEVLIEAAGLTRTQEAEAGHA
ncbi:hypothetical protein MycrhDRAFT_1220 [Mycolicibacterium rhodesiae JS60]|nr:hypothetical protein MycrhDRAFT_1220 [Mycolicibacterium rhodesiae JS60]